MPHTHVEVSQTGFQGRPHEDHEHVKVHRLYEELPTDKSHYLAAAIAEITVGEPVPAHYGGPAVLYMIEGELHIKDESKPDEVTKLVAGDVLHIDHGTHLVFSSPNKAKLFGALYGPSHLHPEDHIVKK